MQCLISTHRDKEERILVEEELSIIKSSPSLESQSKDEGLKPPRFQGEKDLTVSAKLAGVEITLADKHGELLTADTKGKCN